MIIVIGASKGLGKRIAKRLANWSDLLVLVGREKSSLELVLKEIELTKKNVVTRVVDISNPEHITAFVNDISKYEEPIRGFINTAAGFYKGNFIDENNDSIDDLLSTTFAGPVRLLSKILKTVRLSDPFDIINITSVGAATNLDSSKSSALHITTKAAAHLFGVVVGRELASKGVRFCNIAPGTFARNGRPGIPEESIVDTIEFIMRLPNEMMVESIIIRPTHI